MASNIATADFLISSPLFATAYDRTVPDLGDRDWEELRDSR
jgi:methylglyoxal synthase